MAEGTDVGGRFAARTAGTVESPAFLAYRSRGTLSSPSTVQANDGLMTLVSSAYDGATWTSGGVGGSLTFFAEENWTSTNHGSYMSFGTTASGASGATTEKMRITGSGYMGVGTTSPQAEFDLSGQAFIRSVVGGALPAAAGKGLKLYYSSASDVGGIQAFDYATSTSKNLILNQVGGNVGIGTNTPTAKLDVNGTIKAGGRLIASHNGSATFDLGNHDWSSIIRAGTATYDSAEQGMKLTGAGTVILGTRIPVEPNAVYRAEVRMKKIDGTGVIYIGADSLDSNYNGIYTDLASSYNYFAASGDSLGVGVEKTYVGYISGYNTTGTGIPTKFDPEAQFFDLALIANYTGAGNTVIRSIHIEKISNVYADATGNVGIGTTQTSAAFGPSFHAYASANTSTTTSVWLKLPLDSEEFDTDASFNTGTNRFQPNKAGYYQISLKIGITMTGSGGFTNYLSLYKNGSAIRNTHKLINYTSAFTDELIISTMVYLNGTTDYLEGWYTTNSGTITMLSGASTWMSGHWVRP